MQISLIRSVCMSLFKYSHRSLIRHFTKSFILAIHRVILGEARSVWQETAHYVQVHGVIEGSPQKPCFRLLHSHAQIFQATTHQCCHPTFP